MGRRRKMKQTVVRSLRVTKIELTYYNAEEKCEKRKVMELADYLTESDAMERLMQMGIVPIKVRILDAYEKMYWMRADDFMKYAAEQQVVTELRDAEGDAFMAKAGQGQEKEKGENEDE